MKKLSCFAPALLALGTTQACTAPAPAGGDSTGNSDGDTLVPSGGNGDGDNGNNPKLDPVPAGSGNPSAGGDDNTLGIETNKILSPKCASDCSGFSNPEDFSQGLVVIDGNVSADQQASLDSGGSADGLCVSEPATGTIFPSAWTRPRFNATGASGPAKITLSSSKMRHDFVLYAESLPAYLPVDVWKELSLNVFNEDISYTVISDGAEGTGTFQVAPVAAGGSMVFWGSTTAAPGEETNALYGFGVGDEGVVRVIYPGDIQGTALDDNANPRNRDNKEAGKSTCVGCHSSSPDGSAVASMDHWAFNTRVYSIEAGSAGAAPEWLTPAGAAMASMTWMGAPVFSSGDWDSGARRMVTTWAVREFVEYREDLTHTGEVLSNSPTELIWINLASTAEMPVDIRTVEPASYNNDGQLLQKALFALKGTDWKVIPRTGDSGYPVLPDWSHKGKTIVYTSTDVPQDGRVGGADEVSLYSLPFDGGEAQKVEGASSSDFEYYPDYSPDDALIAFNKVPKFATNPAREDSWDHVYYRPDSDIHVVPAGGGDPVRLTSNDPICGGTAGQLYNSWAKWSPSYASGGGRTYYFLIFSTSRNSPFELDRGSGRTSPASQLYMTTVIKESDGSITSGAAIYLWNQSNLVSGEGDSANISTLGTNNVTPAWDQFKIPPVPKVVIK